MASAMDGSPAAPPVEGGPRPAMVSAAGLRPGSSAAGLRAPAGRGSPCPSIGDPMAAAAMPPPPPHPPMKVTKAGRGGKAASTASRGGKGTASTSTRGGKGTASKPSIPFLPTPAARASPAMASPVRQALSCLEAMDSQGLPPGSSAAGLRPPAGRRSLCPSIGDPMAAAAMPPPPPRPPMKVTKAGCGGKAASTASRGGKGIASTSTRGGKGTASKPSIPFLPTPAARASPAMVSPVRQALSCLKAMDSQRLPPNLTDDLLREIFLRASPADLVRASAACASFCRLIADPYFLRRYRSLHPPMLLGFINYDGLHPLQAPHPNAPAACAFARTVDFSFGYIPRNRDAEIMDVRNGCILVDLGDGSGDVAVCDPMSRRCQPVPPLPDDVLASAQIQEDDIIYFVTCVLPSEDIEETAFRLIRGMNLKTGIAISVFSSRSGRWSVTTSINYNALGLDATKVPRGYLLDYRFYYVYGCFYWRLSECDKLLKIDMKTMMLSTHDLPPGHEERSVAFGEAGDGKLAMFSHSDDCTSLDYYIFLQNSSEKGGEWHIKDTVRLPSHYYYFMDGCHSREHIFFWGWPPEAKQPISYTCFTFDIKTFKVDKSSGITFRDMDGPYYGFPPINLSFERAKEAGNGGHQATEQGKERRNKQKGQSRCP